MTKDRESVDFDFAEMYFLRDLLHNEFLFSLVINCVAVILAVAFGKIIHEFSKLFGSNFRRKMTTNK